MPSLAGFYRPNQMLPPPSPYETMRKMAQAVVKSQFDTELRLSTERLVQNIFPHDYLSEYAAVLNWIRMNIRYLRDPRAIEQIKSPRAVVETGNGDCDDMTVLAAAMTAAIGAQVRFVAGAFQRKDGRPVLAHVWAEVYDPASRAWVILDPVPGRNVGAMVKRLIHAVAMPVVA